MLHKKEDTFTIVLDKIAENVFDDRLLERLMEYYNCFKEQNNEEYRLKREAIEKKIKKVEADMEYLTMLMIEKRSEALLNKLDKLEEEKNALETELLKMECAIASSAITENEIEYTLYQAQKMLKNKTLSNTKQLIESLVDRVIIYEDYIQIKFTFTKTKDYSPNPPSKDELAKIEQEKNLGVTFVTPRRGGEGPQPNQGVKFNPTIHYIPYEIVKERTKEYLEK